MLACSHDYGRFGHGRGDRLVREDVAAVDVDLVADYDVLAEHGHVLHAHPLADAALPADDGRLQPAVRFDVRVAENGAALDAHAVLDHTVGADHDVRADLAVLADLGCRVL